MAATASPYGFRPVRSLSGGGYASGITRQYPIASAYDTNLYYGDPVIQVAGGGVERETTTNATTMIGVFLGCAYTDPSRLNYKLFSNYWPADTVAADAVAYVCDDPNMIFQIQADESVEAADLGQNASMVLTTGNTNIGMSKVVLDGDTHATTNTLPLRIVGFVDGPDSAAGDAFTDCLVKINVGHRYSDTLGV
jgi:hypothetical protein